MTRADISGYDADHVDTEYFQNLGQLFSRSIRDRLARLDGLIGSIETGDISPVISLGSNCGPAAKLRSIVAATAGSSYFDNIVVDPEYAARMIRSEFSNILCLKNLTIGEWENHDSVFDDYHRVFYHHYFHLSKQKFEPINGVERRIVAPTDIPLLLSMVRAQFEYLAEKFLRIARANGRKLYVIRRVDGSPLPPHEYEALRGAFDYIGARKAEIVAIHSHGEPAATVAENHRFIGETTERWGADDDWRKAIYA